MQQEYNGQRGDHNNGAIPFVEIILGQITKFLKIFPKYALFTSMYDAIDVDHGMGEKSTVVLHMSI